MISLKKDTPLKMFRKIEIWILYLTIIGGILFSFFFGMLVRQELEGSVKFGPLSESALFIAEIPMQLKRLSDQVRVDNPFGDDEGFFGKPLNKESYLLLSKFDHKIQRNVVELIDLRDFSLVHKWKPVFFDIKPDKVFLEHYPDFFQTNRPRRFRIFNPLISDDGGIIFHHNSPLIKINKCSELDWINSEDKFHHSNEFDAENNIWAPSHIYPFQFNSKFIGNKVNDFYDDGIAKFSPSGELLSNISLAKILQDNNLEQYVYGYSMKTTGDPLHLNDIQPALTSSRFWKKGDLFLSLRNISSIIQYRPSTNKVIKVINGPFSMQHDVNILNDHVITIFDNNVFHVKEGNQMKVNEANRLVKYDFETNSFEIIIEEAMKREEIISETEGRGSIHSDHEVFIEESNRGRIFYFNKEGEVIWKYISAENGNLYRLTWSRIIEDPKTIGIINSIIRNKKICD